MELEENESFSNEDPELFDGKSSENEKELNKLETFQKEKKNFLEEMKQTSHKNVAFFFKFLLDNCR